MCSRMVAALGAVSLTVTLGAATLPPTAALAAQGPWGGTWSTSVGLTIRAKQTGRQVTGTFSGRDSGQLLGTTSADGRTLTGTFRGHLRGDEGVFAVKLGSNQASFSGSYALCQVKVWGHYMQCPNPRHWTGRKG
jgi:hypothetical protein